MVRSRSSTSDSRGVRRQLRQKRSIVRSGDLGCAGLVSVSSPPAAMLTTSTPKSSASAPMAAVIDRLLTGAAVSSAENRFVTIRPIPAHSSGQPVRGATRQKARL